VTNSWENEAFVFADVIRRHWDMENRNNYVRDVSFHEDGGIRHINPGIFARLISFAYNSLSFSKVSNFKGEIYKNTLSFENLMKNLLIF